jgi:tripartite ATP-independent transporter DctP family solute receptor
MMSMLLVGCSGGNKSAGGDKTAPQKVVLKLGTETAASHPETKGSQKLADLVKEKSKGTLEIQVFDSAKIGSMKERTEGMRLGTVDISTSSVGFLASYVPVLGVFDLPYIYKDKAHEFRVFDGEIGKEIDKKMQEKGFRVVCYFDIGSRQITNNQKPINTLADIKGMKIRVPQTEASIEGFKALGAAPTPMAFSEVYMALQQKVVDGQENPLSVIVSAKFNEVQKYLSLTNHQLFIQVLSISEKTWKKLSPEHQKILMEAAKEAQAYEREIAAKEETDLIKTLKDKGMAINEIKDVAPFAEAAKPLREIYTKKLGKDAQDMFGKIDSVRNK